MPPRRLAEAGLTAVEFCDLNGPEPAVRLLSKFLLLPDRPEPRYVGAQDRARWSSVTLIERCAHLLAKGHETAITSFLLHEADTAARGNYGKRLTQKGYSASLTPFTRVRSKVQSLSRPP